MLWDVHPYGRVVKSVFVRIEALQCVVVARVVPVHGGIVLVSEYYARARYAFS